MRRCKTSDHAVIRTACIVNETTPPELYESGYEWFPVLINGSCTTEDSGDDELDGGSKQQLGAGGCISKSKLCTTFYSHMSSECCKFHLAVELNELAEQAIGDRRTTEVDRGSKAKHPGFRTCNSSLATKNLTCSSADSLYFIAPVDITSPSDHSSGFSINRTGRHHREMEPIVESELIDSLDNSERCFIVTLKAEDLCKATCTFDHQQFQRCSLVNKNSESLVSNWNQPTAQVDAMVESKTSLVVGWKCDSAEPGDDQCLSNIIFEHRAPSEKIKSVMAPEFAVLSGTGHFASDENHDLVCYSVEQKGDQCLSEITFDCRASIRRTSPKNLENSGAVLFDPDEKQDLLVDSEFSSVLTFSVSNAATKNHPNNVCFVFYLESSEEEASLRCLENVGDFSLVRDAEFKLESSNASGSGHRSMDSAPKTGCGCQCSNKLESSTKGDDGQALVASGQYIYSHSDDDKVVFSKKSENNFPAPDDDETNSELEAHLHDGSCSLSQSAISLLGDNSEQHNNLQALRLAINQSVEMRELGGSQVCSGRSRQAHARSISSPSASDSVNEKECRRKFWRPWCRSRAGIKCHYRVT